MVIVPMDRKMLDGDGVGRYSAPIMKEWQRVIVVTTASLCAGGCLSAQQERQRADMRRQAQLDSLRVSIERLEERVDGLNQSQQDLYRRLEDVQQETVRRSEDTSGKVAGIEQALKAAEAARAELRKEIVEDISRRMAGMLQSRAPVSGSQTGREHPVQPGETLSEIARAYGVQVGVIVRANNLKNADAIRAGQVLFIPE